MRGDEQADNELSEAQSRELMDGFRHLADRGLPFASDPDAAYQALRTMQHA